MTDHEAAGTFGDLLTDAAHEALAFERGDLENVRVTRQKATARRAEIDPPPRYDAERIRRVRRRARMSQAVFTDALNVSVSTVRAWEQGAREPGGPSLRLLEFAERHPDAFERVVRRNDHEGS
ncbi:MAG: helix-turn-helix domain-containing protein [Gemmatimonadota bacterium]